jgi:two-component system sensor histidine kinase YesM
MKSKWSLNQLLLFSGVLLSALFLLVSGLLFYWSGNRQIEDQLREIDNRYIKQIEGKSQLMIGEMERFARYVGEVATLKKLLNEYHAAAGDFYEQSQSRQEIMKHLVVLATFYTMIDQLLVYMPDGSGVYIPIDRDWPVLPEERVSELKSSANNDVLIRTENYGMQGKAHPAVVFYVRIILPDQRVGFIGMRMKPDWMAAWFESDVESIVQDVQGKVLWSSVPDATGNSIKAADDMLTMRQDIQLGDKKFEMLTLELPRLYWQIGVLFEPKQLKRPIVSFIQVTIISFLGSMLLAFLFSTMISRLVARPLTGLASFQLQTDPTQVRSWNMRFGFREVVLIYYVLILMLPIIASTTSHIYSVSRIIYRTNLSMLEMSLKQTRDNINYFLDMNHRLALNLATNPVLQELLASGQKPLEATNEAYLRKMVNDTASILAQPAEIYAYDALGRSLISSTDVELPISREYLSILQNPDSDKRQWALKTNRYGRESVIFYFRVHELNYMLPIGYLAVVYEERNIETLFRELHYTGGAIDLVDGNGTVFSSSLLKRVGQKHTAQPQVLLTFRDFLLPSKKLGIIELQETLAVSKWSILASFPVELLLADNIRMINLVLIILFGSILTILITSYSISLYFSRSIDTLIRNMKNWKQNQSRLVIAKGVQIKEVEQLSLSFNRLIEQIERLNRNVYELKLRKSEIETERKDSEIRALQMQINPHFLYNTLESVKWMVLDEDRYLAASMIEKLGDFFRKGISRRKSLITIAEEQEYTQLYVDIQNMRLGDRVSVTWLIKEQLLSFPIIKLLLQPLVENTIHHGYKSSETNKLNIVIRIYEEGGVIAMEVEDDGIGILPGRLREIRQGLRSGEMGSHIGLLNVQHRITLQYGHGYDLQVESPDEGGTRIRIRIPTK